MELLADVVRNPKFDAEEIDRQKQQAISSLQVSATDPDFVASTLFDRLVYGFHPYGLPGNGTPETLAGITRDDLLAFHRRYFVPNNMILAVVGDTTNDEAFAMAEKVFGAWPRAELSMPKPIEPPPPTRRIIVVDKPDAVQTEIRVGQLAIPRNHRDYLAWDLAVKILGGEGRQPAAPRAALAARSHLRRVGRDSGDEAGRRLRGRDRHPHRDDRRGAAADGRRVLAPAAQPRLRAGAARRAGVPGRHVPADDRDAERDCHPGAQHGVLRAAARRRSPPSASACRR